MKTINFGRNIYPDVDDNFKKTIEVLKKFNIKVDVLFDDGLAFNYDEKDYEIWNTDGLIFIDPIQKSQVLKIIECFGEISILDSQNNEISKLVIFETPL